MSAEEQPLLDDDDLKTNTLPPSKLAKALKPIIQTADRAVETFSHRTGIEFAPVDIPMARRRQTFAVWFRINFPFIFLAVNIWALKSWTTFYFSFYLALLLYKLVHQTFHRDGGLPIPWLRNSIWGEWFNDYFPLRLYKVADLDPSQNYIFGYHPHGIGAIGTFGAFSLTNEFEKLFPRIDVRICTLKINFALPFYGLFLSFLGVIDASRQSLDAHLSSGRGKAVALVIGGARESLEAREGDAVLYLKSRKGFVKVALSHGASLVPVFAFGENALFKQMDNPKGSKLRYFQETFRSIFGFTIPFFHGRGVFQYSFGLMPKRQPLNIVFGEPIACPRVEYRDITVEMIDEYHQMYLAATQQIFEEHKERFGEGDNDMKFV